MKLPVPDIIIFQRSKKIEALNISIVVLKLIMHVDELLAYKPTRGTKRAREQSSTESLPTKKTSTIDSVPGKGVTR